MRKAIKCMVTLAGVMIAAFGFVACMCETCDIGSQLVTFGTGLAMLVVGAAVAFFASGEDSDVYY